MPPEWGRPPVGGWGDDPRRRRYEWEMAQQRRYGGGGRFEELGTTDEEEEEDPDRLGFTGYDIGARRQAVPGVDYDEDLIYGDEFDDNDHASPGAEWQITQREKEEALAERALRRIRRARLRGDSNVNLSREELDALERRESRRAMVRAPPQRQLPPSAAISSGATSSTAAGKTPRKRSSGALSGRSGGAQAQSSKATKPTKNEKRLTVPTSQRRRENEAPGMMVTTSDRGFDSSGYPQRSSRSNSRPGSSHGGGGRSGHAPPVPMPSGPYGSAPYPPYGYEGPYRPSSSSSSLVARLREPSPTRSLPDEPDWVPSGNLRSRSSSSAQLRAQNDPFAYQTAAGSRRNVSGPAAAATSGVAYSSVKRAMGPAGGTRSASGALVPSRLGGQEVIEISSDEDADELGLSEKSEEESDAGVRADVGSLPPVASGSRGGGGSGARGKGKGKRGRC